MAKKIIILSIVLFYGIKAIGQINTDHTPSPQIVDTTWESINRRPYPQWFSDAKLGIFIHWGLYSVPAYAHSEGYAEWFYRGLMTGDSNRWAAMEKLGGDKTQAPLGQYALLTKQWKGEYWDPEQWASLFYESGAKYIILVTKHHDGYCLWDWAHPAIPDWTSTLSGPKRNIVDELCREVRKKGLRVGLYYSLAEWTNPIHQWTLSPADSLKRYVAQYMVPQFKDLVTKYKPHLIFTDGDWDYNADQWNARQLISWYYNQIGPEAIVNNRWGNGNRHGYKTPEYSAPVLDTLTPWAECRSLSRSFGINHNEPLGNYLSSQELIRHFVTLVASGGGLTLNVAPEADGRIPLLQQERLLDLGNWLKTNGEAIYGTRPCSHPYDLTECQRHRTDPAIDFDWVRNAPLQPIACDHFKAKWTGTITPAESESYTFYLEANDKATLTIDGDSVLSNQQQSADGGSPSHVTLPLKKGHTYTVTVDYQELNMEAFAHLHWSSPSFEKKPLHPDHGFAATYSSTNTSVCYTHKGDTLYAIVLDPSAFENVVLGYPGIGPSTHHFCLLGSDCTVSATQTGNSLTLDFHSQDDRQSNQAGNVHTFGSTLQLTQLPTPWVIKITPKTKIK